MAIVVMSPCCWVSYRTIQHLLLGILRRAAEALILNGSQRPSAFMAVMGSPERIFIALVHRPVLVKER